MSNRGSLGSRKCAVSAVKRKRAKTSRIASPASSLPSQKHGKDRGDRFDGADFAIAAVAAGAGGIVVPRTWDWKGGLSGVVVPVIVVDDTTEALQALMAAVCKTYAAQIEAGEQVLPLPQRGGATATDVMVTASGLLKAANLAVFELGMWQSWTGR